MTIEQAAVVGLGLIGGSFAGALRQQGIRVKGVDADVAAGQAAAQLGLIDELSDDLAAVLDGADVVVLCVPPATVLRLLPEVDRLAPPSTMILDTASVKVAVTEVMSTLVRGERAIGGHPLAGKEASGPAASEAGLFRGHTFILTPSTVTSPRTMDLAAQVVRMIGGNPYVMPAARHDEVLARTSHLPQILSTALALDTQDVDAVCIGPALRDMTRLAGSDPTMWRDILMLNRQNVVAEANGYIAQLREFVSMLEAGETARIEGVLRSGRQAGGALRGVAA